MIMMFVRFSFPAADTARRANRRQPRRAAATLRRQVGHMQSSVSIPASGIGRR
jgi:hypothetical protein